MLVTVSPADKVLLYELYSLSPDDILHYLHLVYTYAVKKLNKIFPIKFSCSIYHKSVVLVKFHIKRLIV